MTKHRIVIGLLTVVCLFIGIDNSRAQTFDFVIETSQANETFTFRIDSAAGFTIDWGDGTIETDLTGSANQSHSYVAAGIYTNRCSGTATRIAFGGTGTTPLLLRDIVSRLSDGVTGINSTAYMFYGANTITQFTQADWFDATSSNVTTMASMFVSAPPSIRISAAGM